MFTSRTTRITMTAVMALQPNETLRDTEVKGFGVRRRDGAPSYFLQTRVNGRLKWITIGIHGTPWTPTDARKEALRLLVEAKAGRDPNAAKREQRKRKPKPITLAEVATRFIADHGAKLKDSTRTEYVRLLDKTITPALGRYPIKGVDRADVTRFHNGMKATPNKANFALAVLSKLMNWCEIEGYREPNSNPCRHVRKYKEKARQRFLTDQELDRLGRVLSDLEARNEETVFVVGALRMLLLTGARLGEILPLEWRYVDLQRGHLTLPDSKTGQKVIFLNGAAIQLLQRLPRVDGNPHVFVGLRPGGHIINLQKPWRRIRTLADIEDVRIHDLRHSFASVAAAQGASLQLIGRLLGHATQQTTQRYAHLVADQVRAANEDVGEKLAALVSPSGS